MSLTREDLSVIEGEARVSCRKLQKTLSIKRLQDVHRIISRNEEELRRYGSIFRQETYKTGPGRPGVSFFLNEGQAVLVCMFSRTERAADARQQIIEVFLAWRRGDLHGLAAMRQQAAPVEPPRAQDVFTASADRAEQSARHLSQLSEIDGYLRELTHLPIWPSKRRPSWWHHLDVREFLTVAHRQMSTIEAEKQGKECFGESCPGKSAIHIYWQRLDGAKSTVEAARRARRGQVIKLPGADA